MRFCPKLSLTECADRELLQLLKNERALSQPLRKTRTDAEDNVFVYIGGLDQAGREDPQAEAA